MSCSTTVYRPLCGACRHCPPPPSEGDAPPPAPCTVTHFAPRECAQPQPTATKAKGLLADTTSFYHLAVGYLQTYLQAPLPLPSMQQVFVPAPLAARPAVALAGCAMLSSELLFSARDIEPAVESRRLQVECLARQWVGVLLRAARPWDQWLVDGLVGHLEEVFLRRYFGRNEAIYRCGCGWPYLLLCVCCLFIPCASLVHLHLLCMST